MIVTNVGALPEMVPDGKVGYVTDVSAAAVADAILKYFNHPEKDSFVKHIIEEKRKYSWDVFIENIIGMYIL